MKNPDFTDVKSGLAECLRNPNMRQSGTYDNFVILHLKKLTYVFRALICVNYPCVVNATKQLYIAFDVFSKIVFITSFHLIQVKLNLNLACEYLQRIAFFCLKQSVLCCCYHPLILYMQRQNIIFNQANFLFRLFAL